MFDEELPPLGVVPLDGRGRLPFALVHGESLLAAASWALQAAGVELLDMSVPWDEVRDAGRDLVVHDPLCPLTPVDFLESAVEESRLTGAVVVGVRPVTDTVKLPAPQPGGPLGRTVERDGLVCPVSPLVLPAAVVAALEEPPRGDLAALVVELTARYPVRHLDGPALGRRVVDEADLEVLGALSDVLRGPADRADAGGLPS